MKSKLNTRFYILIAALLILGSMLCACSNESAFSNKSETPTNTQTGAANNTPITSLHQYDENNYVEVIYFHRTQRCNSCRWAGDGVEYVINNYFKNELQDGRLVFRLMDVQDKANSEIVKRYGAYTSSLFINKVTDGIDHIEQVTKIWLLIGKTDSFVTLVKGEIEKQLEQ